MYQFSRIFTLVVGDPSVSGVDTDAIRIESPIDIRFRVSKSIDNTSGLPSANFEIYNLSSDTRNKLESIKYPRIEFSVGYSDATGDSTGNLASIFTGNGILVESKRKGNSIVTSIKALGYFVEMRHIIKQETFPNGKTVKDVIEYVVSQPSMEGIAYRDTSANDNESAIVVKSNAKKAETRVKAAKKAIEAGYSVEGTPFTIFNDIAKSHRMYWFVDNNEVTFRDYGAVYKSESQEVIEISLDSGLIFSSRSQKQLGNEEGMDVSYSGVNVKALINPAIRPTSLIKIVSTSIDGIFQVRDIVFNGDTRGDWEMEIDAVIVKE